MSTCCKADSSRRLDFMWFHARLSCQGSRALPWCTQCDRRRETHPTANNKSTRKEVQKKDGNRPATTQHNILMLRLQKVFLWWYNNNTDDNNNETSNRQHFFHDNQSHLPLRHQRKRNSENMNYAHANKTLKLHSCVDYWSVILT